MKKAEKRLKNKNVLEEELKGKIFLKLGKIDFGFNLDPSSDKDQEEDTEAARGATNVDGLIRS